jgi:hypothetical protein
VRPLSIFRHIKHSSYTHNAEEYKLLYLDWTILRKRPIPVPVPVLTGIGVYRSGNVKKLKIRILLKNHLIYENGIFDIKTLTSEIVGKNHMK